LRKSIALLLAALGLIATAGAQTLPPPIHVTRTAIGTYKASLNVGIGSSQQIPFGFDTGSTGLHVFADVTFTGSDSGVRCTKIKTQVVYGNPPAEKFTGFICSARLHIGAATTLGRVRFAYLTKIVCLKHAPPGCPRDIHSFKSMGSYGVFGAGLTGKIFGKDIAPPPLLHLPGRYGLFYSIVLGADSGDLILGSRVPPGATMFRLIKTSTVKGQKWAQGGACLFVNEQPINTCLTVSFDTGNGVPWLHNVTNPLLPLSCNTCGDCGTCGGTVVAGTSIGFGHLIGGPEATSVLAGDAFSNSIADVPVPGGRIMTNTGIQAFFHHIVTYDAKDGAIFFAPAGTTPE
jgi:hypothetical protein